MKKRTMHEKSHAVVKPETAKKGESKARIPVPAPHVMMSHESKKVPKVL